MRRLSIGELALALGVVALGIFFAVETGRIPVAPVYSRIGPRVFPAVVSAALILIGLWLAWESLHRERSGPAEALGAPPGAANDWRACGLVSLGLILHVALIKPAGFVLASAVLFAVVARAFGSRRWARDGCIGLALAAAVFVGFTYGLDLSLPRGVLGRLL